jgi:hypothetical protein
MEIYRHLLPHSLRSDVGILGAVDSGGGRATMGRFEDFDYIDNATHFE